jgi:hypothetical protein
MMILFNFHLSDLSLKTPDKLQKLDVSNEKITFQQIKDSLQTQLNSKKAQTPCLVSIS